MNIADCFNAYGEEDIFLYSSYLRIQESIEELEPTAGEYLSTPHPRDSMVYISQFLALIDQELPFTLKPKHSEAPPLNNGSKNHIFERDQNVLFKKQKIIKKLQNSPFHNYQKHLNNALKKMVIIPKFEDNDEPYKQVASQIWNIYLNSDIKTKKILHAVFNERNEHEVNEAQLKTYGFWDIYCCSGDKVFNQAKIYLSKLAIDQIDVNNIEVYLNTRKLKTKDGFKEYMLEFRQQLCNGYLKRRANLEQIHC